MNLIIYQKTGNCLKVTRMPTYLIFYKTSSIQHLIDICKLLNIFQDHPGIFLQIVFVQQKQLVSGKKLKPVANVITVNTAGYEIGWFSILKRYKFEINMIFYYHLHFWTNTGIRSLEFLLRQNLDPSSSYPGQRRERFFQAPLWILEEIRLFQ